MGDRGEKRQDLEMCQLEVCLGHHRHKKLSNKWLLHTTTSLHVNIFKNK